MLSVRNDLSSVQLQNELLEPGWICSEGGKDADTSDAESPFTILFTEAGEEQERSSGGEGSRETALEDARKYSDGFFSIF